MLGGTTYFRGERVEWSCTKLLYRVRSGEMCGHILNSLPTWRTVLCCTCDGDGDLHRKMGPISQTNAQPAPSLGTYRQLVTSFSSFEERRAVPAVVQLQVRSSLPSCLLVSRNCLEKVVSVRATHQSHLFTYLLQSPFVRNFERHLLLPFLPPALLAFRFPPFPIPHPRRP